MVGEVAWKSISGEGCCLDMGDFGGRKSGRDRDGGNSWKCRLGKLSHALGDRSLDAHDEEEQKAEEESSLETHSSESLWRLIQRWVLFVEAC